MEGIEHVDLLTRSVARIVLSHGEPLGSTVHVKIAKIGDKLWTVQVITDIGAKARQDEIVDPNASLFAADVAPLLVLSRKGAIKVRGNAIIELQLRAEFHRHRFWTPLPLQRRDASRGDLSRHSPLIDPQDHSDRVPT